mmetsp:Transcript_12933/g.19489  ORF Transcript_12933/g.19489 Transcript_12933/m.19489 type:complete len:365 (+) Transcript_12933:2929-4023(+)
MIALLCGELFSLMTRFCGVVAGFSASSTSSSSSSSCCDRILLESIYCNAAFLTSTFAGGGGFTSCISSSHISGSMFFLSFLRLIKSSSNGINSGIDASFNSSVIKMSRCLSCFLKLMILLTISSSSSVRGRLVSTFFFFCVDLLAVRPDRPDRCESKSSGSPTVDPITEFVLDPRTLFSLLFLCFDEDRGVDDFCLFLLLDEFLVVLMVRLVLVVLTVLAMDFSDVLSSLFFLPLDFCLGLFFFLFFIFSCCSSSSMDKEAKSFDSGDVAPLFFFLLFGSASILKFAIIANIPCVSMGESMDCLCSLFIPIFNIASIPFPLPSPLYNILSASSITFIAFILCENDPSVVFSKVSFINRLTSASI